MGSQRMERSAPSHAVGGAHGDSRYATYESQRLDASRMTRDRCCPARCGVTLCSVGGQCLLRGYGLWCMYVHASNALRRLSP
jgi:hypothetical protein